MTTAPLCRILTANCKRSSVIKSLESNPHFSNPLVHSTSPYLRQHAHNPVFWYPWGKEALMRARTENKPIHLSIGYSACYWCHVMEREVFENLSIASLMNRMCINIKVDREEHPELDEIYMVARQLLTHQGGWPNTLFLTPDLKPFYAGGTYAPDESYGKTSFPKLLEWLNTVWTTQEEEVQKIAEQSVYQMIPFLVYTPPENPEKPDMEDRSGQLFKVLKQFYDQRAGGFFQSPKFPHECYLDFLLGYYQASDSTEALDMVTLTLRRMAAGGIFDQVGCGFHRYAVDKEWYVPHFEKMLYNQALLAKLFTDAARITANPYMADIAKGILEFVGGPMTSGNGPFFSAIDAETDGLEGAHYAWTPEEFKEVLTEQEITILTTFYALAEIPHFQGHKKVEGQVLILRKPLDDAARERKLPYLELSSICGDIMNKLLVVRNKRPLPRLDDKVIVSWNGLMIDAFAHAGKVFNRPSYTARAREALDFLLENAIDNNGKLNHLYAGNRPQLDAVLEDYAFLVKGIVSLHRVTPDPVLLEAALSLMQQAEDAFADKADGVLQGYFSTENSEDMVVRIKNCDDSSVPNANAVMAHNLIDLFEITQDRSHLYKAQQLVEFFLSANSRMQVEHATMIHAGMRWHMLSQGKTFRPMPDSYENETYALEDKHAPSDVVTASVSLFPADAPAGSQCEILVSLEIKDGWHINAYGQRQDFLIPTQLEVQGAELLKLAVPEPLRRVMDEGNEPVLVYEGLVTFTVLIKLPKGEKRNKIKVHIRYQACNAGSCFAPVNVVLSV